MPVYDYQCGTCSKVFANVYREYDQRDNGPACCESVAGIVWLTTPGVIGAKKFEPYLSPIDGRPITSERARTEDMARNGCIPYEDGIKQDQIRRAQQDEADTERLVDKIVSEAAELTAIHTA
jgi:hypothetical protein